MYLPPNVSSNTNHVDKIKNYEINSLLSTSNIGFSRTGFGTLWTSVTFNYGPSTFINYIDILASAGFVNVPYPGLTLAQNVQIRVTYVRHDGVNVSLYDTGDVFYKSATPQILAGNLNINTFVKSINVYLYNLAVFQLPFVSFGRFRAYGSYDSGVRFRKGSNIYSLAHEPTATNYIFVKRNGSNFKIPLVSVGNSKASPVRVRKNGVIYALKKL